MKKLLLLSLLAMGTTSFAAVSGNETNVNLGIKVQGRVFEPAGTLVVTPDDNITPDGRIMAFNLGDIPVNTETGTFTGGFKVERLTGATNGDGTPNPGGAPVQMALITAEQKLEATLAKTSQIITVNGNKIATLTYGLGFTNLSGDTAGDELLKEAVGNVTVSARTEAVKGNIVDTNELRIVVSAK